MRCFDIGRVLTLTKLQDLKANGFEAIAPYLDPFNAKGCTPQYLKDIATAGLKVPGFFFETTGGSGAPGYFSEAQGKSDAAFAESLLSSFGALVPKGVIVWYAADINIEPSLFTPYANGIATIATAAQTPGIYGYQRLCDYARTEYPVFGKHLAQTYGVVTGTLDLWQHEQVTINGTTVDVDDVSVPGWVPGGGDMTPAEVQALIDASIAAYAIRLQAELDSEYATKAHMHPVDPSPPHTHTVTGTAT